jgi:ubiquinone/menaquinone biosynthesis C-methylase UbiE
MGLAERTRLAALRREVLVDAQGTLLIVGAGQAHDLLHLPAAVTEVLALEPDPAMRRLGQRRLHACPVPARWIDAPAEAIPLADHSVDTVLCSLVLCSVDDPATAIRELRRVLRPGGHLLVLEHVHARPGTRLAGAQTRLDPFWGRLAGGCHLDRDTRGELERAGFTTAGVRDRRLTALLPLIGPALMGAARPGEIPG